MFQEFAGGAVMVKQKFTNLTLQLSFPAP